MSPLAKVFIVLIAVLALVSFGAVATVYTAQKSWKTVAEKAKSDLETLGSEWEDKREELAGSNSKLEDTNDALTADLNSRDTEIQTLKEKVRTLETDKSQLAQANDQVRSNLKSEQEKNNTLTQSLSAKDQALATATNERQQAEEDAKNAKTANARLVLDMEQLQGDLAEASVQLNELNQDLSDKKLTIDALVKAGVPVGTIIDLKPAPPIDAVVSRVSSEDGLAVLNVGSENGVEIGHQFTIFRDGNFVARAEVVTADPTISAVRILYKADDKQVTAGASASTRLLY